MRFYEHTRTRASLHLPRSSTHFCVVLFCACVCFVSPGHVRCASAHIYGHAAEAAASDDDGNRACIHSNVVVVFVVPRCGWTPNAYLRRNRMCIRDWVNVFFFIYSCAFASLAMIGVLSMTGNCVHVCACVSWCNEAEYCASGSNYIQCANIRVILASQSSRYFLTICELVHAPKCTRDVFCISQNETNGRALIGN